MCTVPQRSAPPPPDQTHEPKAIVSYISSAVVHQTHLALHRGTCCEETQGWSDSEGAGAVVSKVGDRKVSIVTCSRARHASNANHDEFQNTVYRNSSSYAIVLESSQLPSHTTMSIPVELIYHILDFLESDNATLHSCSLVSSFWSLAAQRHLLSSIFIFNNPAPIDGRIRFLLQLQAAAAAVTYSACVRLLSRHIGNAAFAQTDVA